MPSTRQKLMLQQTAKKAMAVKTSKVEAGHRKVERMLTDSAKRKKVVRKAQAVRKAEVNKYLTDDPVARKKYKTATTAAERLKIVKAHFKKMLSGKAGNMQGKK